MNFGGGIEFGNEELLGIEKRLCVESGSPEVKSYQPLFERSRCQKRESFTSTNDGGFGQGVGLVSVRILSTHIPIRIALPLISSRAFIPFLAPLFATPKMQKITTTDL